MAQGAPGEFAADALLRIAALDKLAPARRIRLLEDAFSRAAEAQQPLKRRNAMQNLSPNAAFLEHAFAQDLRRAFPAHARRSAHAAARRR